MKAKKSHSQIAERQGKVRIDKRQKAFTIANSFNKSSHCSQALAVPLLEKLDSFPL